MSTLKITSDTIQEDGTAKNAKGGTELMRDRILGLAKHSCTEKLFKQVNIIHSRVRDGSISWNKKNILVLHDTWDDPENTHLNDRKSIERFSAFVFVSYIQMQSYLMAFDLPRERCYVIRNGIEPFDTIEKGKDKIRLIYHTTPHRGLEILVPVYEKLCQDDEYIRENTILDVYSSFSIYGWSDRDRPYEPLFERCRQHPNINYHGAVPNEDVRKALTKAHIFAYPSIWPETSCLAAIEALAAGCWVVCSDFGALPETTLGLATTYAYTPDIQKHANLFATLLRQMIRMYETHASPESLMLQKSYTDNTYDFNNRSGKDWLDLIESVVNEN